MLAGPFATMQLGDLGADVIKVERPGSGDETRSWGPPFIEGESAYFLSVNRNKRSIALDLASAAGRVAARALVAHADVVVENFRPGTMDRLGLGYEAARESNPAVVYCSISGFGSHGPGARLAGYDFVAQAVGGLMSITGPEPGTPTKVGVAVADVLTGLFASNAILGALYARSATGTGQLIELDLFSSLLASLVNQASTFLTSGSVPHAIGNRHPTIAPYETLSTKDRALVVAVGNDGQFAALARVLGMEEAAKDERYATNESRVANRRELVAELESALSSRTADEWTRLLGDAGVPAGPINDIKEAFALATSLGLDPVRQVGPPGDSVAQVSSPMRLSATPVEYHRRPPRIGEHTAEVLAELGLDVAG